MKISRHALIFGLSYALDIAGKNNLSHSKSTAYISVMIGRKLGLSEEQLFLLYYAALLHDIAVGNEYILDKHCALGEETLKKLPLPKEIPTYVLYHHEYHGGTGPFGLSGNAIPLCSKIICFASAFDDTFGKNREVFNRALYERISQWFSSRKAFFSEEILNAFAELVQQEAFLLDYFSYETKYTLSNKILLGKDVSYGYEDVLKFALCFADIIDRRSPFTVTHSLGIAGLARKATAYLGYNDETQNTVYIAGLLHDVGKLHVPTDILHKNGPLNDEERFEINKHTYYSRKILEQIPGFEDIVEYGANHHERMDGTGYPYRMRGETLSEIERVMAICDVYQALSEKRPYRDSLPDAKVWGIIDEMGQGGHLCAELIPKLKLAFAEQARSLPF